METNSQKYHRLVKESKQYYQQTHGRHGGAIRDSGHLDYDRPGAREEHNRRNEIHRLERGFSN